MFGEFTDHFHPHFFSTSLLLVFQRVFLFGCVNFQLSKNITEWHLPSWTSDNFCICPSSTYFNYHFKIKFADYKDDAIVKPLKTHKSGLTIEVVLKPQSAQHPRRNNLIDNSCLDGHTYMAHSLSPLHIIPWIVMLCVCGGNKIEVWHIIIRWFMWLSLISNSGFTEL